MSPPIAIPVERHRLGNGLRVVVHRDPALPLVAVNLWYHVGSKNERPGQTGLAHLFEHMLFQGSAHVGPNGHFALVQQAGGIANGSTGKDRTNYYETLPSHHLDLGLWLEADRMGWLLPGLEADKLETQRQVVMNERRERIDNQPYGRSWERVWELLFPPGHPYHWPVIGYLDDIAAASLDEVRAFFATYYSPANAVLTLAGDLEPEAAFAAAERYFGSVPGGQPPAPVPPPPLPPAEERREVLEDAVELPRVLLAWRAPAFGEPLWYAAEILATALAEGTSSPLHQDLVYRREIAQGIAVYVHDNELASPFMAVATGRPGVEPDTLVDAITAHVAAAAESPPRPADLERARRRLTTHHYSQLQRLDGKADALSQLTTYFDDPGRLATELDRLLAVDACDLVEVAARHLAPDRRVVVSVVPRSAGR
jgi:predicted Zn-dependent peptidase